MFQCYDICYKASCHSIGRFPKEEEKKAAEIPIITDSTIFKTTPEFIGNAIRQRGGIIILTIVMNSIKLSLFANNILNQVKPIGNKVH